MLVELDLKLLLYFSRKLIVDKNDIETLFFWKQALKSGCALYMGAHCAWVNMVVIVGVWETCWLC